MATGKNPFVRLIVPLVLFVGVGVIAWQAFTPKPKTPATPSSPAATSNSAPSTPAKADVPAGGTTPSASTTGTPAPNAAPAAAATTPSTPAQATPPAPTFTGLRADISADAGVMSAIKPLGSLDPDEKVNPFAMEITFSPYGGGFETVALARQRVTIDPKSANEVLQRRESFQYVNTAGQTVTRQVVPFAVIGVRIGGKAGQFVRLDEPGTWSLAKRVENPTDQSITLQAIVRDAAGTPVLRLERSVRIDANSYNITLDQRAVNLTTSELQVEWMQHGPIDLPTGVVRYGGDSRRLRIGSIPQVSINPDQQWVASERFSLVHADVLGTMTDGMGFSWSDKALWPNAESTAEGIKLSWVGLTSRYFSVTAHALSDRNPPLTTGKPDKSILSVESVDRVVLGRGGSSAREIQTNAVSALRFFSPVKVVKPDASADFSMGVYAGPISPSIINRDPLLKDLHLDGLVVFSFGGPCGFCTFQWLARFLRSFLGTLHDYVVFDWALAIILLVVCVRTLLHPITKWSQTSIQRFGKQMAALAPKQKKLQEKYASDPAKLREEMAKLMKEENVNYAGALGCLPMFLQTPVWIALSAMIFFTFELRHTPAFFGVFQSIIPNWSFLGDLSEPDHLILFPSSINIPLLSMMMGPIDGINLLPVIMGVLFWAQQKYLTPPPTTEVSPEMQSQQKIMKFMIVFIFPLFMYNAPSALVLYFLANSALGIVESSMIRKQVERLDKEEEERKRLIKEGKIPAPPPKPPGFFTRMKELAEAKQREVEARKKNPPKKYGPGK
ncbi:MAG: membrane protein insertase YidC [Phycisphaerales bacterium]|nr:membrane protein insertase YidC [Phycisphaerales bacterium]